MSASSELIRVEDLHKSFGSLQVLKGVSETISKGEVVSIIGPSGGHRHHRQERGHQPPSAEDGNGIPAF